MHPNLLALATVQPLEAADLLAESQRHAVLPHLVDQRIDDLEVDEAQQSRPLVDHGDPDAERGENGRVLEADDACADDNQRARQFLQGQDLVAGEDLLTIEIDMALARRRRADGDDDSVGGDFPVSPPVEAGKAQLVRIDEGRVRLQQLDPVAQQLMAVHVELVGDDVVGADQQVRHRNVPLHPVRGAVDIALPVAGEVQHRLPERLARDGAGVDAGAADDRLTFHNGRLLAELGRLYRCPVACGS